MKTNRKQFSILLAATLLVSGLFVSDGYASQTKEKTTIKNSSVVKKLLTNNLRNNTFLRRKWGVETIFVQENAGGYMLEFRYKVLDGKKAEPLFRRQIKPVLTHKKTGAKLIVPTPAKTGALRNSNLPKTGKTYWMFFANPGNLVKPGDKVSIKIGKFEVKDLVVK